MKLTQAMQDGLAEIARSGGEWIYLEQGPKPIRRSTLRALFRKGALKESIPSWDHRIYTITEAGWAAVSAHGLI